MTKAAIVILAGTEGHENLGRIVNGLETAKEFEETEGDEVEVIFDVLKSACRFPSQPERRAFW